MATTTSDEAYIKLNLPHDFTSAKSVPDSFVWPQLSDKEVCFDDGLAIPVVDLRDPNAPQLLTESCMKWGVLQLKGHGVSTKLMEDVEAECERLFSLPIDRKMKAVRPPGTITGYGNSLIQSFFPSTMWYEGFTIVERSAVDQARLLWPDDYQGFCDRIEKYQKQMKALAEQLIRILFKSLRIPTNTTAGCILPLQLNSYPPCPDPTKTLGLAPHTDTSLVTILRARTSGLQVFKDGVGWIPVNNPERDSLTVNVGDLSRIISNGRFVSVLHRVVAKPMQRYSVAYFFRPPKEFVLSPVVGDGEVARYREVKLEDYDDLKRQHLGKALSFIEN